MDLHHVIRSPDGFDVLRRDDARFEQVAALESAHDLDHVGYCRLAQYYFYKKRLSDAETALLEAGRRGESWLARALSLMHFEIAGDAIKLGEAVRRFTPAGSSAPLDLEAFGLGFEICAFHYGFNEGDAPTAVAFLHRAEGIALGLGLSYRLGIIHSKLSFLAAQEGLELAESPLTPSGALRSDEDERRSRYLHLLSVGDTLEITQLALAGVFERPEVDFAAASARYADVLEGEHSPYSLADDLTRLEPGDAQLALFQALLMLQTFTLIGEAEGRLSLNRVNRLLKWALEDLHPLGPNASFAAAHFPLGLHLAAALEPTFAPYLGEAAVLKCRDVRNDGLWRGGDKLATVPRMVREALVLDGATASSQHFNEAVSGSTGNRQNRARFRRALEKAELSRGEFAGAGQLWRGYRLLNGATGREDCLHRAERLEAETPLIQQLNLSLY